MEQQRWVAGHYLAGIGIERAVDFVAEGPVEFIEEAVVGKRCQRVHVRAAVGADEVQPCIVSEPVEALFIHDDSVKGLVQQHEVGLEVVHLDALRI